MSTVSDMSTGVLRETDFSIASSTLLIPSLSPLTDRSVKKATPAIERIAQNIESQSFYTASWDRGIHVTPSLSATTNSTTRPRTPSFLTFTNKALQPTRPQTSGGLNRLASSTDVSISSNWERGGIKSAGSLRHDGRLTKSLNNFLGGGGSLIPAANIMALSEPGLGRPSTKAGAPTAALLPQALLHLPALGATERSTPPMTQTASAGPSHETLRPETPKTQAATVADASLATNSNPDLKLEPAASVDAPARPNTAHITNMEMGRVGIRTLAEPLHRGGGVSSNNNVLPYTSRPFKRRHVPHPMAKFKPSRAQALLVFNRMDVDKSGKVTLSEMENAAIGLGLGIDKAQEIFNKLDKDGKGFLTTLDWGNVNTYNIVQTFSHLYMRRFLGLPDISTPHEQVRNYLKAQELRTVQTLSAALNMVRMSAVTQGSHAAVSCGDVIYDAFRFIDTDNSGELTKEELKDGFAALGVNLSESVSDQICEVFDKDKSGTIGYVEFVNTLFPKNPYK
ncbi:hypothetical protein CEUSTIGMA_g5576.t1 [Chlamydomonas eustigma]|uniref:EF-hand domain-containing protein n=1 Tax=Chlamydomonas eustigma TaxID=1157962 RepID=A0A250X4X4_9CHLO|nr:hypothetical protein CEUSTIGMA_g5576.t1 [Chlamydomonas eustigma]|eukprot:GAX78134.1 hypothetical protein CEUSTIGMA_g5576.t1 [Chlamydomonas eustigma]